MTEHAANPRRSRQASDLIRVAFDHRIFLYQKHGGVSRYFVRLVEHLPEFGVASRVLASLHINEHLQDLPRHLVWGARLRESRNQERFGRRIGEALFAPLSRLHRAQIAHETYFSPVRIAPTSVPVVLTVYDMTYELYPNIANAQQLIANKQDAIRRADRILCISENTRKDLLRFYPEAADRASVTLLGFDSDFSARFTGGSPHPRPYLLYVGMRWRVYKNFTALVEAFGAAPQLSDFDLVCIGGGPFTHEERDLFRRSEVGDRVIQREADDQALKSWYRNAVLFTYPSLYEGFGIPPLEAMAADCPVVCVRASAVPEVCGAAAEYAEPGDTDSLREALVRVALSADRASALREAGRERLKLFSWRECARQTSEVYRDLL